MLLERLTYTLMLTVAHLMKEVYNNNQLYRKDTEPLYHAFMYSPIILLSSIYPFTQCLSLLVTIMVDVSLDGCTQQWSTSSL